MFKKLFLSGLLCFACSAVVSAQRPVNFNQPKLDLNVKNFVYKQEKLVTEQGPKAKLKVKAVESADETMTVNINTEDANKLVKLLQRKGYEALYINDNVVVAELPASVLKELEQNKDVFTVRAPRQFYKNMKTTRDAVKGDLIHKGQDLETPFDGTGVIVGVIDQGFQFKHVAFLDENKVTRIKKYLDHSSGNSRATPQNGAPSKNHDGYNGSHATHVTNIAAGSKVGDVEFYGMAPKADLYIVPSSFSDAVIEAAVKRITDYAAEEGRPCVINMSFGATTGPHDGTTLYDQTIDKFITDGKCFVAAAMGNEGNDNIHATYTYTSDNQTRNLKISSEDKDYFFGEVWCTSHANGTSPLTITPFFYTGSTAKDFTAAQLTDLEDYIGKGVDPYNNKQYYSFSIPYSKIKTAAGTTTSELYLGLKITANANTTFHAWVSNNYSTFQSSGGTNLVKGDSKYTVGEGAASIPHAIAVASYNAAKTFTNIAGQTYTYNGVGNVNEIANYSSKGPWFGTQPKPMVAAPGSAVVSAYDRYADDLPDATSHCATYGTGSSKDYWGPMNGTSMATPVVTGTLALWLQANPDLTYDQVLAIFKETSTRDTKTGSASATVKDESWGYGKLNAYAGIKKALEYRTNSGNEGANNSQAPVTLLTEDDAMRVLFNNGETFANIRVYTPSGKIIENRTLRHLQAGNEEVLSYYDYAPGIYMVNIQTTRGNVTRKILVK